MTWGSLSCGCCHVEPPTQVTRPPKQRRTLRCSAAKEELCLTRAFTLHSFYQKTAIKQLFSYTIYSLNQLVVVVLCKARLGIYCGGQPSPQRRAKQRSSKNRALVFTASTKAVSDRLFAPGSFVA